MGEPQTTPGKKNLFTSLSFILNEKETDDLADVGSHESTAVLKDARDQQPSTRNAPSSPRGAGDTSTLISRNDVSSRELSLSTGKSECNVQPVKRIMSPEHSTSLTSATRGTGERSRPTSETKNASVNQKNNSSTQAQTTSDVVSFSPSDMALETALPRPITKRKRSGVPPLKLEAKQIFQGLAFYFFPNNDVNTGRRMRIRKAIEYGAVWIKDWAMGVTHVIVDRDCTYAQLLSWLKQDSLPSGTVVVDELYPVDCIIFRALVEPSQIQYRVTGQNDKSFDGSAESSNSSPTQSSFRLKPKKKAAFTSEPQFSSQILQKNDLFKGEVQDNQMNSELEREAPSIDPDRLGGPPTQYRQDSFDEIVQEVKSLEHLPLEENEEASEEAQDVDSDSEGNGSPQKPIKKSRKTGNNEWQDTFQCMKANDGKGESTNPNAQTIEILEQMGRYYDRMQDHWRTLAYRRAVTTLKREKRKIATKEEAVLLPFIGERIAAKIEEIVWTNRLRRLENAQLDTHDQTLQLFLGIYGVGFAQASVWVRRGFKSLDDLLQHDVPLTDAQRIGIAHHADFEARIPRAEVTRHAGIVRSALYSVDPDLELIMGGSYRRGAASCGDIDCIVTHATQPLDAIRALVVDELVPRLFAQGYLKAKLAASLSRTGGSKWHGASSLPAREEIIGGKEAVVEGEKPWRRIDFLLVAPESRGAALIYFTGNDVFNRSIRLLASKKGMRLNQYGLFRDVMRGPGRAKVTEGTLVEGRDERRIFEVLGVPWREPEERIC